MTTEGQYMRALEACEAACRKWQAENPDARLRFVPIPVPVVGVGRTQMIAGLDQALERGVAGNSATRKLLQAIDRTAADKGGATVMMAEYALEQVYGLKHALTRQAGN